MDVYIVYWHYSLTGKIDMIDPICYSTKKEALAILKKMGYIKYIKKGECNQGYIKQNDRCSLLEGYHMGYVKKLHMFTENERIK